MKKWLMAVLSVLCVASTGLALGSCGGKDSSSVLQGDEQIKAVYEQYVVYVSAQGETPLSYEEWLATIKGEKGDKGANGVTPQLRISQTTNEWEVSYDNGATWSSLGVKATGGNQTESKLHFQRIAGKDEYRVIGLGTETEIDIVIPSTYNSLPVTEIGESAFEGHDETNPACMHLRSVVIPDSVTTIGEYAFNECSSLTSVSIGDSVTMIGESAFWDCSSLTSVKIGDSVTTIGNDAFGDCSSLTSIIVSENNTTYKSVDGNLYSKDGTVLLQYASGKTATSFIIPDSVTTIGEYAFDECSSLTSVSIPNSVTTIGEYAFNECSSLTSVSIPDSVTTIGDRAFFNCSSLTSVEIGDSVTSIGYEAFYSCSSLTSVTIGDSVTTIGEGAFYSCSSLTSVTIGDSVTSIGGRAFSYCSSLTSVEIGDSVTTIGGGAFWGCSSLTSVTIGDSVTTIGGSAFYNCSSLTSVTFADTSDWYYTYNYDDFINKTGGTQIDVTSSNVISYLQNSYYFYKL